MTNKLILQTGQTLACGEEFRGQSDESCDKGTDRPVSSEVSRKAPRFLDYE